MIDLPDVNVWLALVDENHAHHEKATAYWQEQSSPEVAFCRVTALAFLRLSTHSKVLSRPLSPGEAWAIYHRYRVDEQVGFILDSPGVDQVFMEWSISSNFPQHLWTDCYLAALAKFRNCRIVSFDQDFKSFRNLEFLWIGS